ncbi:hypothetical protein ACM66B_006738 [Microbotryomycetes sp. NB124-2]
MGRKAILNYLEKEYNLQVDTNRVRVRVKTALNNKQSFALSREAWNDFSDDPQPVAISNKSPPKKSSGSSKTKTMPKKEQSSKIGKKKK